MDEEAVSELVKLGLTRYEAQGYLALIGRETATAETARLGRIPRPRAYDVLASHPPQRRPVSSPRSREVRGCDTGRSHRMRSSKASWRYDGKNSTSWPNVPARSWLSLEIRFLEDSVATSPLIYVEVLRDPAHAVQRVERLWNEARNEILAIVCPPILAPPGASRRDPADGCDHSSHLRTFAARGSPPRTIGPHVRAARRGGPVR